MSTFPDRLTPVTVISGAAPEELSLKGMERFSIDSCLRGCTYNDIWGASVDEEQSCQHKNG